MNTEQAALPLVLRVHPDVSGILGICKEHAYDLVKREDFPSFRIGRTIRIPRDAFFTWMDAQAGGEQE